MAGRWRRHSPHWWQAQVSRRWPLMTWRWPWGWYPAPMVHRPSVLRRHEGMLPERTEAAASVGAGLAQPSRRHSRREATCLNLLLVGDVPLWVAPEDVVIDELADAAPDIVRQLLPVSRDLHRLVLVPGIRDVGHVPEVQVFEPEPPNVEGAAVASEDVLPAAGAHPRHHLSIALEPAAAVHGEDEDNVWRGLQRIVELLLVVALRRPHVV